MSVRTANIRLYTQREIADALGITARVVALRAQRGRPRKRETPWPVAERIAVRGGYAIRHDYASLPPDVRQALDEREAQQRRERALV